MLNDHNDNNDKNNINNNNLLMITSNNNNNNKINELKRKIDTITKYQKSYILNMLNKLLLENPINAEIICNYIVAEQNEINIKESTKETKIKSLVNLSKFFANKKSFYDMTKEDILDYLNNLRKPSSSSNYLKIQIQKLLGN